MNNTTRRRTARKPHWCSSCRALIPSGAAYLEHKSFPGSDDGWGDAAGRPVRMVECANCATHHMRDELALPC